MTTDLRLKMHTVILLVGPSNCGKSYFATNRLIPALREKLMAPLAGHHGGDIAYISSDDLRREVLDDSTVPKYDRRMMQVSERAFKLLHTKLDLAMEWPYNAKFVVVDTTGLSEEFRAKVVLQAKAQAYHVAAVVFDYKDRDEYLRHVPPEEVDKRILSKHLDRLRTDVWRTLKRNAYDSVTHIKSKDFEQVRVSITDLADYSKQLLDPTIQWDVVGDVHGCLDELRALFDKAGYVIDQGGIIQPPPGRGLVIGGDFLDKGPHSLLVLRLLHANRTNPAVRVLWGNHENFAHKFLAGMVKVSADEEYLDHFDCATSWGTNDEARTMLNEVADVATSCVMHPEFVVTHAPCPNKHIGKLDQTSGKMQRGQYRRPKAKEHATTAEYVAALEQSLSFIKDEAIAHAPYHIFGHVTTARPLKLKNQVGIDTGCQAGGALTMASLTDKGLRFLSVPSTQPKTEEFVQLWERREREVDLAALTGREFGRVMWAARNKVSFISGTMAPAEADPATNNLESLDKALDYYRSKGVKEVVLQPKYMGSRCNVYLSAKPEECYAVSRSGFVIKPEQVDLQPVFAALRERFANSLLATNKLVVLDGELMPWRALGAGLIEEQFKVLGLGLRAELAALRALGFEEVQAQTLAALDASGWRAFSGDKPTADKAFGQARAGTYRALLDRPMPALGDLEAGLATYEEQVALHGADGPPSFKPFGILLTVAHDDEWHHGQAAGEDNAAQFALVSDDLSYIEQLEAARGASPSASLFFRDVTEVRGMEGIVVKPRVITPGVAPALKVRGPKYLHMVYGPDYLLPAKLARLIRTKRTRRKVETSIAEFELGQRLLSVPRDTISEENKDYLKLVAQFITEEQREQQLDPRL